MSDLKKKAVSKLTNARSDGWFKQVLLVLLIAIESLLVLRLILKLVVANPIHMVIKIIYSVSDILVGLFLTILAPIRDLELVVVPIIETRTIVAMFVFALIAHVLSKMMLKESKQMIFALEAIADDEGLIEKNDVT